MRRKKLAQNLSKVVETLKRSKFILWVCGKLNCELELYFAVEKRQTIEKLKLALARCLFFSTEEENNDNKTEKRLRANTEAQSSTLPVYFTVYGDGRVWYSSTWYRDVYS